MFKKIKKLFRKPKDWKDIEYFHDHWRKRIEFMAQFITTENSVVDLGCGQMWLKDYLKLDKKYIGVDYRKRSPETIIADFNKNQFPQINTDICFISGCLEYIDNPNWFFRQIATYTNKKIIMSYCVLETHPNIKERESLYWKNNLTANFIITEFKQLDFELERKEIFDNNTIFVFDKCKK